MAELRENVYDRESRSEREVKECVGEAMSVLRTLSLRTPFLEDPLHVTGWPQ